MDLSNVEAIIFDSDGVLVDSEIIHIAAERELLAELGLVYDLETYTSRFVGFSNADFQTELAKDYRRQSLGDFPSYFGDRLKARVWPRIEAELQPIAGVEALVTKFGGPVAVASSAVLPRLMHKLKITDLFDIFAPNIYSSDHVENGKPEPDLFLLAAEKLGVAASKCLVIEDSENGVRAGRRAGMLTVGFTGGSHVNDTHRARLLEAGAHFVAASHSEIANAVQASP